MHPPCAGARRSIAKAIGLAMLRNPSSMIINKGSWRASSVPNSKSCQETASIKRCLSLSSASYGGTLSFTRWVVRTPLGPAEFRSKSGALAGCTRRVRSFGRKRSARAVWHALPVGPPRAADGPLAGGCRNLRFPRATGFTAIAHPMGVPVKCGRIALNTEDRNCERLRAQLFGLRKPSVVW